ncbi:class I SAM-dependent methyltransferase [Methanoregula sp.]|uniref:class I SAM-dependent methyltransferase n=1 Tax=Methanoregula sp. TaxID=2052170 RepID=UPI002C4A82A8|nr:methyltransferase domain-containing protein [Methanoregula sp.]HVP96415.1 methyltransferase domain-containing protein [Methanoregula sp.]
MDYIRKAFDAVAAEYDAQRESIIPDMRNYYDAAIWAAESTTSAPAILDIGAGTGLLSALLLEKYPAATITLLDISENMLAVARERFSGRKNIWFRAGDYAQVDLGGPYDLVCSALSIHHLEPGDKCRLFRRVYQALAPGGLFINADQAEGETPYFTQRYLDHWNDFLASGPLSANEHAGILQRRDTLDKNEKLSTQLVWLCEAGFSDVDVVYKNRTFVVTVARKV